VVWQFFSDRWLNIMPRSLTEPLSVTRPEVDGEDLALRTVLDSIESICVHDIGQNREFLSAGFSGDRLLSEMGLSILRDDNGWISYTDCGSYLMSGNCAKGHPARNQLLVGLSRWATDVRKRAGSQSAVQNVLRFARGQTALVLYES
jgi:hypothetical protein